MMNTKLPIVFAALTLSAATAGCAVLGSTKSGDTSGPASEALAGPEGWLIPAEIVVDDNGLHYAGYLREVDSQAKVALSLTSPDGTTKVVYEGRPPATQLGDLQLVGAPDGSSTRMRLGTAVVPADSLQAGNYRLTLNVDGQELDSAEFELLSVPNFVGGTRLQVSPKGRVMQPYLQRAGLTLWLTKTPVNDMRSVYALWLTDGEPKESKGQKVFSPTLGVEAGRKNLAVLRPAAAVPYVFRAPRGEYGTHEAVLVSNGEILGAVSFTVGSNNLFEGIEQGAGKFGTLKFAEPSAEALAYVTPLLPRLVDKTREAKKENDLSFTAPKYCALIEHAEARESFEAIKRAQSSNGTQHRNQLVTLTKSADRKVRERAKSDLRFYDKRGRDLEGNIEKARADLQKLASTYDDDCLKNILPPAFAESL